MSADSQETTRRSTRVRAQIPIRVTILDPADPFSEDCHTVVVNPDGCGVRLSRECKAGTPVSLDQLPGGGSVTAKVANCVPIGTEGRFWLVGIALDQRANIWCIQPAPADWGTEIAESPVTTPLPKKKDQWPYSVFSSRGEAHPGRK